MRTEGASLLPVVALGVVLLSWPGISRGDDLPSLGKDDGPYMVLAYSYRGPQAEAFARALALELRKDHALPAFLYQATGKNGLPDFLVLVGDCKTTRDAFLLCRQVKKIKPKSPLNPSFQDRGLTRAITTTNPLHTFK